MVKNRNHPESLARPLTASLDLGPVLGFSTILRHNPAGPHVPVSILPIRQPCLSVADRVVLAEASTMPSNHRKYSGLASIWASYYRCHEFSRTPLLGLYERRGRPPPLTKANPTLWNIFSLRVPDALTLPCLYVRLGGLVARLFADVSAADASAEGKIGCLYPTASRFRFTTAARKRYTLCFQALVVGTHINRRRHGGAA